MTAIDLLQPAEVFPTWPRAQRELDVFAREVPPAPHVLRTTGLLTPARAERITDWFLGADAAPDGDTRRAYRALARETAHVFAVATQCLGVRVRIAQEEPYESAAELCAELREHGTMTLVREATHPLLSPEELDRLRVVHDVFGHAALGLGFDLQSEYATWLQCRTLFSAQARPAAFCELVGAVTAYVGTGEKPGLRAKLPPAALL